MRIVIGCGVVEPDANTNVLDGVVKFPLVVKSKSIPCVAVAPPETLTVT
jgi:hypothetical protein